jgi:hypothetical protein
METPKVKRRRFEAPPQTRQSRLTVWLRSRGAVLDDVELRDDAYGGLGVFASGRTFAAGDVVLNIPIETVLTTLKAVESPAGRAMRRIYPSASSEAVLFAYMCIGRADATHPWHEYLATLPVMAPDPLSWTITQRARFAGTDFGLAIAAAEREIDAVCAFAAKISAADPVQFPPVALSVQRLRWARGMYRSRRLPASLAERAQGDDEGVLVPFLDFFNHSADAGSAIQGGTAAGVSVTVRPRGTVPSYGRDGGCDARPAPAPAAPAAPGAIFADGAEVCIHYGARTNQDLVLNHGFALRDNPHDTVRLALTVRDEVSGRRRELGPFHVTRDATDPIPTALWRALSDPLHWRPRTVEEEEALAPPEVGVEEVEMLIATLRRKLSALPAAAPAVASEAGAAASDADALALSIDRSIDACIEGHRDILSSAIALLAATLEAAGGSSDSGSDSASEGEGEGES